MLQQIDQFNKEDLILLDLCMPGRDGYAVAKCIRSQNPDIIIYAVTGLDKDLIGNKVIESGFKDVLEKPIKYYTFLNIISGKCNERTKQCCERRNNVKNV